MLLPRSAAGTAWRDWRFSARLRAGWILIQREAISIFWSNSSQANCRRSNSFFGFAEDLEEVLGRPVDLVEPSAVRNPYLRAAINRSQEVVYGS